MKAAILHQFGVPLSVEEVAAPVVGTGEVLVDVAAAPVLSYAAEVLSGARRYLLPTPVVPGGGAIGRVRAVGPDATRLQPGDWVFCDPTVRSRDGASTPDITLQGISARGEGGQKLQRYFRDGTFAEQVRVPTENAAPIGAIDPAKAGPWCAMGTLLIAYGGLLAMDFRPGETLLVSGSTGNFGSATVALALAMGARCVVAPGRNAAVLDDLRARFGGRLVPVRLTGDGAADTDAMKAAAPGPIDAVQDFLPPSVSAGVARAAIMTLRQGRAGGADGRRGHDGRRRAGAAVSLDHAQPDHGARAMDVRHGRHTRPGGPDPRRSAGSRPVGRVGVSAGRGQRRRRPRGGPRGAVQVDGARAIGAVSGWPVGASRQEGHRIAPA